MSSELSTNSEKRPPVLTGLTYRSTETKTSFLIRESKVYDYFGEVYDDTDTEKDADERTAIVVKKDRTKNHDFIAEKRVSLIMDLLTSNGPFEQAEMDFSIDLITIVTDLIAQHKNNESLDMTVLLSSAIELTIMQGNYKVYKICNRDQEG